MNPRAASAPETGHLASVPDRWLIAWGLPAQVVSGLPFRGTPVPKLELVAGAPLPGAEPALGIVDGPSAATVPLFTSPHQGAWWLEGDGWGGWRLWHRPAGGGGPGLWLVADRHGGLHVLAQWVAVAHGAGPGTWGLRQAWLRTPGGPWLVLEPRAARHPLWGACDEVRLGSLVPPWEQPEPRVPDRTPLALLPAQDYARLQALPPLDRPAALVGGGGAALLNLLACLLLAQGQRAVPYRGPYPTPQLFHALGRSFLWKPGPALAQAPGGPAPGSDPLSGAGTVPAQVPASLRSITIASASTPPPSARSSNVLTEELALASFIAPAEEWMRGAPAPAPQPDALLWEPRPFAWHQPHPDVQVHLGGPASGVLAPRVQAVWVRGVPFRPGAGGGQRLWAEESAPGATATAGLLLLGQPYRVMARVDGHGRLLEYWPPAEKEEHAQGQTPGPPLDVAWEAVVWDWTTISATPALAGTVAGLRGGLALHWRRLPLAMVAATEGQVYVQWGAGEQFRHLAVAGGSTRNLALMLVSDVLSAVAPLLRNRAQTALAAQQEGEASPCETPAGEVAAGQWLRERHREGLDAQRAARERLQSALPALLAALAAGGALPPEA